jgi:hypothetical protein
MVLANATGVLLVEIERASVTFRRSCGRLS